MSTASRCAGMPYGMTQGAAIARALCEGGTASAAAAGATAVAAIATAVATIATIATVAATAVATASTHREGPRTFPDRTLQSPEIRGSNGTRGITDVPGGGAPEPCRLLDQQSV